MLLYLLIHSCRLDFNIRRICALKCQGNNVSTKNKNKSGRRRKRPPFAKSQRAVSSKTSKKKQQPWDDRTGIDREIRNERVMNKPRRRPKQVKTVTAYLASVMHNHCNTLFMLTQKKLPMSEKNIVQFMKHILQYRRKEVQLLVMQSIGRTKGCGPYFRMYIPVSGQA